MNYTIMSMVTQTQLLIHRLKWCVHQTHFGLRFLVSINVIAIMIVIEESSVVYGALKGDANKAWTQLLNQVRIL